MSLNQLSGHLTVITTASKALAVRFLHTLIFGFKHKRGKYDLFAVVLTPFPSAAMTAHAQGMSGCYAETRAWSACKY